MDNLAVLNLQTYLKRSLETLRKRDFPSVIIKHRTEFLVATCDKGTFRGIAILTISPI